MKRLSGAAPFTSDNEIPCEWFADGQGHWGIWRFNKTSIETPRLLAQSRRNSQSLGAMSPGVSFTVA